jgi:hypothetical protein
VAEVAEASSLLLERADLREAYQTKATARLRDFDTEVIARQTREALAL